MLGTFCKINAIPLLLTVPIAVVLTACSSGEPPKERVADPAILVFSPPGEDGPPIRPAALLRKIKTKAGAGAGPKKVPVLYIKPDEKMKMEDAPDKPVPGGVSTRDKDEASGRSKDSLRTFNDK